jgi:hypothetical protein
MPHEINFDTKLLPLVDGRGGQRLFTMGEPLVAMIHNLLWTGMRVRE